MSRPPVVELDVRRGYYRVGNLMNKKEGYIPEGHLCLIEGFHIKKGKVVRRGTIGFERDPEHRTRIRFVGNIIEN